MFIVVVGGGGVGASIAEYFSKRGDRVVVIEKKRELCDRLVKSIDAVVYCGDVKSTRLLRDAEVEKADILFAVTGSDSVNLWVASVAKAKLGIPKVVVRVNQRENVEKARSAGADVVVCLEELAAERLIEAVVQPDYRFLLRREGFAVAAVKVLPDSKLVGASTGTLREKGLSVVAVLRGSTWLAGHEDHVLESDDEVVVAGPEEKVSKLIEEVFE